MEYLFDKDQIQQKVAELSATLDGGENIDAFVAQAAGVIYNRLKDNIQHYRQYGVYWWALKDVLRRQDYNMGDETNADIERQYKGDNDAQTLVMADTFYLKESATHSIDNMDWTIDKEKDYRLFDEDMEMRSSITDMILDY